MVISAYMKIGTSNDLWFSGSLLGIDQIHIKFSHGPWLVIKDMRDGKFEVKEVEEAQHGTPYIDVYDDIGFEDRV